MTTTTGPDERAAVTDGAKAGATQAETPSAQPDPHAPGARGASRSGSRRAPGSRPSRRARARSRLLNALAREWLRALLAIAAGFGAAVLALVYEPDLNYVSNPDPFAAATSGTLLMVLFVSVYRLAEAALAHLALRDLPHSRLLAVLRAARRERLAPGMRWFVGRGTTLAEAAQMLLMALLVVFTLQARPPGIHVLALFALTAIAIIAAWVGCVIAYAQEYALVDAEGDGFRLEGAAPADRLFEDYVHMALLVQTSNAPADFSPLNRRARRLMRAQSVLAHVLVTVVIALGASALLTVVQPG